MSLKSRKLIAVGLALIVMVGMLAGCTKTEPPASEKPTGEIGEMKITVTDGDKKTHTFDKPITKAVVYDRYNTEVFRAVGAYDVLIGVDQDSVDTYPEYWTGVGDKIGIVGASCTDFNVEEIIELKPDAVFTSSLGEYDSMREQLKSFNIPVVVINAWIPSEFYDYIKLVGDVTGHSDRAEEYIKFCKDAMEEVSAGLASIPEDQRKTVYFENNGEYKTSIPGSGWHDMVESAGGKNIFGNIKFDESDQSKGNTSSYEVDPEAIISANPDVMIKNIYSTKKHNQLEAAVKLDENEIEEELAHFIERPGWDELKSIKDKEVYGFTSFLGNANSKLVAIMYISKWLYPETFTDLDPDAFLKQWCQYMGFEEFQGHAAQIK